MVAITVALLNLAIATPAACAVARLNVRRGLPVLMFYLATRMIPLAK